jgi:transcriptional regulator with XRE-family HTH domain
MRELRHQHGLSAKTLADLADIDMRHVYRLEAEKRPNVSAVVLARVAVALDVTLEYLLGLTDDCQTAWIL